MKNKTTVVHLIANPYVITNCSVFIYGSPFNIFPIPTSSNFLCTHKCVLEACYMYTAMYTLTLLE